MNFDTATLKPINIAPDDIMLIAPIPKISSNVLLIIGKPINNVSTNINTFTTIFHNRKVHLY